MLFKVIVKVPKSGIILKIFSHAYVTRAYPSSEFVVANTLAKWKKLESNEIDFSQGFSLNLTLCLLAATLSSANNLCKQFGPRSKCRA